MKHVYDVVIVGAGIVGCACARELSILGMRVAVIERDVVGSGATAAGMGHIVAMDDSPAQLALTRYSQQLWQELISELPTNVEYDACGTLWVAANEEELHEAAEKQSRYRQHGIPSVLLDAPSLAEAEPQLRRGLAGGLLVSSDAVIYPPTAALWLLHQACAQGAALYAGRSVMKTEHGTVTLDDSTHIAAEYIVIATGSLAAQLIPSLPIRPRKGHLAITDRYPGMVRHQLVELGYIRSAGSNAGDSVAFNVQPRKTGQLLIGSSRQYETSSTTVEPILLQRMLVRAASYMPSLTDLSILRVWTGFRAATPDKLPLIGPWPADSSILLATGHEGLGITTSLATGRLLADHLAERSSVIARDPYLPARFAQKEIHA